MAHRKAGGSTKNLSDSKPKYLGVKRADGSSVGIGEVIVRQRGTRIIPGAHVGIGRDHTLFSKIAGIVSFRTTRKTRFDGKKLTKRVADVTPM